MKKPYNTAPAAVIHSGLIPMSAARVRRWQLPLQTVPVFQVFRAIKTPDRVNPVSTAGKAGIHAFHNAKYNFI